MKMKLNEFSLSDGAKESYLIRLLLPAIAFFAPWGEGIQFLSEYSLSKVFVALVSILIVHWALFLKTKLVFPKWFTVLIVFVFLHTIVAYFFFTETSNLLYVGVKEYQNNYTSMQEGYLLVILRFFLFASFGYALAREIKNTRQILLITMFYGFGLLVMFFVQGYQTEIGGEVRYSGGFLDANAFGLSGLTAIFLGLLGNKIARGMIFKATSLLCSGVGLSVLVASSSRGSLVGVAVGVGVLVLFAKTAARVKVAAIGLLMILCVSAIVSDDYINTTQTRVNFVRMEQDGGSGRLAIWSDYLRHFTDYALIGVGMGRSRDVISADWSYKLAVTHNLYLQLLVEYGVIGFFLFIAAFAGFFREIRGVNAEVRPFLFALLVAWLSNSFFLNTILFRDTWILLATIVAMVKCNKKLSGQEMIN